MSHIATHRQFARNLTTGWVLLAAEVATAFLLTPFIVARLGAAAYGVWTLMISVVGYMGLIDVGIRGSVGRYINHYLALGDDRAVGEVVSTSNSVLSALSLLALLASFGIAAGFAQLFPKTPPELLGDVRFALPLLAVGLWLSFVSSILGNLLAAREALYLSNQFALLTLVLRTAAIVLALRAGHGIAALVLVTIATSVFNLGIAAWAVKKVYGERCPRMLGFSGPRLQELWRYGIASFTSRTAATMANDSAPVIGMWVLGPEAVAVYSVAMTLTQYTRRLIDQAATAVFPSVMKAAATRDVDGLRGLYLRYMDLHFTVGSLVYGGVAAFAWHFLSLWVGPAYQGGALVVGILAFGYLMQGMASTAPLMLAGLDRVNLTMKIALAEALACVLLMALLPGLAGLGLAGMALGTTLPRLATSCALYPRLAAQVFGPSARGEVAAHLRRNLLNSAGVALAFGVVAYLTPRHSWTALVAASTLVTLGHVLVVGTRSESFSSLAAPLAALRRWRLGGGGR